MTKKGTFLVNADGEVRPGLNWRQMTPAERRDFPEDWEAGVSHGPINYHSEEHLVTSDRGIVRLRKIFYKQLDVIKSGGNPVGVQFDTDVPPVQIEAGIWISQAG